MVQTTYFVLTKAEFDACMNGWGESVKFVSYAQLCKTCCRGKFDMTTAEVGDGDEYCESNHCKTTGEDEEYLDAGVLSGWAVGAYGVGLGGTGHPGC